MIVNNISRREFIKSAAVSAILLSKSSAVANETKRKFIERKDSVILEGKEFHLTIDETVVNITGKPVIATTINGMLPAPTLKWKEGDEVTIHVTNNLPVSSSIHWHGIILPFQMDGVPNISFPGIAPGETFTYRFKVQQSGTFWYHSHSGFQEQTGMHGTLVIEPKEPEPFEYDCDYVVSLSDWSDEKPENIFRKLKIRSDYYNFNQRTIGDFFEEVKSKGFMEAFKMRKMWNEMRMSERDLSDVTAYTYTFLMNGKTDEDDWHALFKSRDKVRLRFVNQSAMTIFDVRIPGLKMKVVAADGNFVQPVEIDEFRIGVAETYDVIVEPEDRAYCIFAQSIDRSGFAAGTLAPKLSMTAKRPSVDETQPLIMADMGMGDWKSSSEHSTMHMDHSAISMSAKKSEDEYPITPLPIKWGVGTTMRAKDPRYRLDDPGVGLRDNGRKVLTYADLKNFYSTAKDPKPDREIILHLTGNMERFMWSINGISFSDAKPLKFNYGERLRITFINDTMMNHPMHLHGMWSDLETGDDNYLVRKHTILVQPGSKISFRVTVDAKGAWAFHCHMLYHMPGMFRKVEVV
ncbi:copper resistance system multicopper oxidase [Hydrogenimonas thermophila]|uniref:copper resistance system multicopper oxidase n=1 Tax=Hydrogenimonas thermophila TaxID=223786 RepID=UPI0029370962|nr:copper resistance system multicopper oxidase [Hydrogenimonas thermophila]WOE70772.1 copper resistance system multicopper oxidase [Hydrogenimonas thermophila]WOE73290.1 copper resistance system multicopper oxidase [Hydrogenimonas thermophila]